MAEHRIKQPGDVLLLSDDLEDAVAGYYVLDPCAAVVTLCLLGEDIESGDLVSTGEIVAVPPTDLCCFQPTNLTAEIHGRPANETLLVVELGDILEPSQGASVPVGLYQVMTIEQDDILLSRVHSNADAKLATTGRVSWIARADHAMFRRLRIATDLRP